MVFPEETRRWLEEHAGGKRAVPAYVRQLVERQREAEREAELLATFNRAAEDLTEEDREERLFTVVARDWAAKPNWVETDQIATIDVQLGLRRRLATLRNAKKQTLVQDSERTVLALPWVRCRARGPRPAPFTRL